MEYCADRKPYTSKLSLTACKESSFACDNGTIHVSLLSNSNMKFIQLDLTFCLTVDLQSLDRVVRWDRKTMRQEERLC